MWEDKTQVSSNARGIFDYVQIAWKYRWMILFIWFVGVLGTGVRSRLSTPMYQADAAIVPPTDMLPKDIRLSAGLGGAKRSLIADAMGITGIAEMYVGILRSRAVEDALVDRFDLMRVYGTSGRAVAQGRLDGRTGIRTSRDNIVRISVQDEDPNRAAALTNAYIEELDRQNKRLSMGQATSKRTFLQSRLEEIEGKLSKIENVMSRDIRLQEMLIELLTQECELAKIEEARSMPTIQILDNAVVPESRLPRGTKKNVMLASFVSIVMGFFLAFGREYWLEIKKARA
jgi:tyrosine-protein kinase Etk/Wzc